MSIVARTIQVELPIPPREASPNHRTSPKRKAAAVAKYRRDCYLLYRAAKVPPLPPPIVLHLDYYLERPATLAARYRAADDWNPEDDDNATAAFKAGRDALVDAGVIARDTTAFVTLGHCRFHSTAPEGVSPRCVVATLEYLTTNEQG